MVDYNRNRETSRAESQGCPCKQSARICHKVVDTITVPPDLRSISGTRREANRRLPVDGMPGCNLWLVAEWTQHGLNRREKIEGWGHVCHGKKTQLRMLVFATGRAASACEHSIMAINGAIRLRPRLATPGIVTNPPGPP
jgi:hypothetical protein